MNPKLYKAVKIKSGRPRCPFREKAVLLSKPRYVDEDGIERFTASGNQRATKRCWETNKRRASGVQPQQKAPFEIIAAKNVANVKRWRKANPDKLQALRSKGNFIRRSAVRGRTVEPVTSEFLAQQRELQDDCCAYCTTALFGLGHQDHVIPIAKGGAHAPFNIVWACEPCNLRKGAKLGWVPFWGRK